MYWRGSHADAAGHRDHKMRGILLIVLAFATFSMLDATAKYLSATFETPQIVFARYFSSMIFAVAIFAPIRGVDMVRSRRPLLQVVRATLLLVGTFSNFVALHYLPLAQVGSIIMSIPLFVCALSAPLLGEPVGGRRWAAVIVGFIGVLIVMRPGFEGFSWAALFSLNAAFFVALYQVATRKVAASDAATTTLFFTTAVGAAIMTPVAPFFWTTPDPVSIGLMLALGLLGGGGHYLLIHAHHLAPAAVLAPFSYSQIVWMTLIGVVVFGHFPDHWTIAGAFVVVGSGLYVFHRERLTHRV